MFAVKKQLSIIVALVAVSLFGDSLVEKTFTGAKGTDWADAANWSPEGVPDASSAVTVAKEATAADVTALTLGKLTIAEGGRLTIKAASAADPAVATLYAKAAVVTVAGELKVEKGGVLIPDCELVTGTPVVFKVGSFSIEDGGKVDATGRGYGWVQEGAPEGASVLVYNNKNYYTFAPSYATGYAAAAGNAYIGKYAPCLAGSQAHVWNGMFRGGGVVCIHATAQMSLAGEVSASAENHCNDYSSSAGGSVWLTGADVTVASTAKLAARGSTVLNSGSGARGGCISIGVRLSSVDIAALVSGNAPDSLVYTDNLDGVWTDVSSGYKTSKVDGGKTTNPGTVTLVTAAGASLTILPPPAIPAPAAVTVGDGTVVPSEAADGVTLTAAAAEGSTFLCWTGDFSKRYTTAPDVTVSADKARELKAYFVPSSKAEKTYVGASGGSWNEAGNWYPAGVPGLGDDVTISLKDVAGANIAVGSLTLQGGSLTLTGKANVIAGDLTVKNNAKLSVAAAFSDATTWLDLFNDATPFVVGGVMSVESGSTVIPISDVASGAAVSFFVGSLSVDEGASIDASKLGWGWKLWNEIGDVDPRALYLSGSNVDKTPNYTLSPSAGSWTSPEPGYGGDATDISGLRGKAYGYACAPFLPGSPDGFSNSGYSRGGGTVLIRSKGLVTLNGSLLAEGEAGLGWTGASGGGVWVVANVFRPGENALISAKAGGKKYGNNAPGGGRICVSTGLNEADVQAFAAGETPEGAEVAELTEVAYNVDGGLGSSKSGSPGTAMRVMGSHGDKQVTIVGDPVTTADSDPVGTAFYPDGSEQTFYAAADHGDYGLSGDGNYRYRCQGYEATTEAGTVASGHSSSFSVTIPSMPMTVTWNWGERASKVTLKAGEGGVISDGDETYDAEVSLWQGEGETVTLTAVPSAGKEFVSWSGTTAGLDASAATITLETSQPRVLQAVFADKVELTEMTFTGAKSSDWTDPDNWEPAGVPDGSCSVTLSKDATLADVTALTLGKLTIAEGGVLTIKAASAADPAVATLYANAAVVTVAGELKVEKGGVLIPECDVATGNPVVFKVGIFTLAEGGSVNATGKGYGWVKDTAPAGATVVGQNYTFAPNPGTGAWSAAGNGYILKYAPYLAGSQAHTQNGSFRGGGVVCIHASSQMTLAGDVSASAQNACCTYSSSAGGSVWLTAGSVTIASTARLAARGSTAFNGAGARGGCLSIGVGLSESDIAALAAGEQPPLLSYTDDLADVWTDVSSGYKAERVAEGNKTTNPGTKSLVTVVGVAPIILPAPAPSAPVVKTVGSGTVDVQEYNGDYILTATAAEGSTFFCWTGDVKGRYATDESVVLAADRELTAYFVPTATGTKTFVGSFNGDWAVAENWDPAGVPGLGDAVTIAGKAVMGTDIAVGSLVLNGGSLTLSGKAHVVVGDLKVTGGAKLMVSAAYSDAPTWLDLFNGATPLVVGGAMSVEGGATVIPESDVASGAAVVFRVGSLTVAEGASIDASKLGWGWAPWDTIGDVDPRALYLTMVSLSGYYSQSPSTGSWTDLAPGYGGAGKSSSQGNVRSAAYGYALAPFLPGSPSGIVSDKYDRGGGTVLVRSAGVVTLNGTVAADGEGARTYTGAAGGGVWIIAKSFKPGATAVISAKGVGRGNYYGPGGGRVCVATGLDEEEIQALAAGLVPADVTVDELTTVAVDVSGGFGLTVSGDTSVRRGETGTAKLVMGTHGDVQVQIKGSPVTTADSDPVGSAVYAPGSEATFYAAADHGSYGLTADGSSRYRCKGYVISNATEQVEEGSTSSFTMTLGNQPLTVTWLWENEEKSVRIDVPEGGSLKVAETVYEEDAVLWFSEATARPIEAVPDEGFEFVCWTGDVQYGKAFENPLVLTEMKARQIHPVFRPAEPATARTWKGGSGSWLDAAKWEPAGIPGAADAVVISSGSVACANVVAVGSLALSGNAQMVLPGENGEVVHLRVAGDVVMKGTAALTVGTSYQRANGIVDVGGDLRLEGSGNTFKFVPGPLNRGFTHATGAGFVNVGGFCHVTNSCWIVPECDLYDGAGAVFRVNKLKLDAGGGFDANAKGYYFDVDRSPNWIAPGRGAGLYNGGGYGGRGGTVSATYGLTYGQLFAPVEPGSLNYADGYASHGAGGGLVRIVAKRMDIDGTIRANGGVGFAGGSGGGIWLVANKFAFGPNARLSARGGGSDVEPNPGRDTKYDYGGGGGGRIALTQRASEADLQTLAETGTLLHLEQHERLDEAAFEAKWGADIIDVRGGAQNRVTQGEDGTFIWYKGTESGLVIFLR